MKIQEIQLTTEINCALVTAFGPLIQQFVENGVTQFNIFISSDGGEVGAGIALYNIIKSLPVTVHTFNIGNVGSIANAIFMAGDKRYALKNSRFLYHQFQMLYLDGLPVTHSKLIETVNEFDFDLSRLVKLIEDNIDEAELKSDWRKLIWEGTILDSQEALHRGVIHEVLPDTSGFVKY